MKIHHFILNSNLPNNKVDIKVLIKNIPHNLIKKFKLIDNFVNSSTKNNQGLQSNFSDL